MCVRFLVCTAICSLFAVVNVCAQTDGNEQPAVNTQNIEEYCSWEAGQIVSGDARDRGGIIDHQWTTTALIGVRLHAIPVEQVEVVVNPEFKLYYPFPEQQNVVNTVRPNSVAYLHEAKGTLSFGDRDKPYFRMDLGLFLYKYNSEARDFGEYLFRTGTYPYWVITDFDFPMARLLGFRLSTLAIDNLKLDVLLNSEYQFFPLYDFSLSCVASYRLWETIELGAGVNAARILPVNERKTSPKFNDNVNDNFYVKSSGDTAYYSFQATKLMFRASIDPKRLLPFADIFGKEDLKIYGEMAVIGLDDFKAVPDSIHPAYYNDIMRRIPVMVGFNVPTFKLMDALSVEAEYFHSGIPNNYQKQEFQWTPMPYILSPANYDPKDYTDKGLRWSVYGSFRVLKGFNLTGQVAYDHLRTTFLDGANSMGECMNAAGHWYWVVKTTFRFK